MNYHQPAGCQGNAYGPKPVFGPPRYPIGMGYVPVQEWESPYPLDQGFLRGTIFPSLDYPFQMRRCSR